MNSVGSYNKLSEEGKEQDLLTRKIQGADALVAIKLTQITW